MNAWSDFITIVLSLLVEGIPFIVIGALLASFAELLFPGDRIVKMFERSGRGRYMVAALLGMIVPVCECGNIPFARKLIQKGVPHPVVITFLFAAPVMNPIVIASTFAAFPGAYDIVAFRVLATLCIAIVVGMVSATVERSDMVRETLEQGMCGDGECAHQGCAHSHAPNTSRVRPLLATALNESIYLIGIFTVGALCASAIQILVPKSLLGASFTTPSIAIIAMMTLAFVVSICSNVDAFYALSYVQVAPMAAVMGFLVLGPMLDIKAIPMLRTIFSRRAVLLMSTLIMLMTFVISYLYYLLG